ncbi:MAG: hypothetical protein IRZ05_10910 [Micromonosporaceae bacterium]|jgi:hypothetical protein|nr:hypothetical protein [Micromonosporaceae bacterium]
MVVTALWMVCLAGQLLLLVSAVRRMVMREPLRATIATHALLPTRLHTALGIVVEAAQLTVGIAGPVVFLAGDRLRMLRPAVAAGTAALYVAFAVYLAVLLAKRGRISCGCVGGNERAGLPSIVRALGFAATGGWSAAATPPGLGPAGRLLVLGGALLVAGFAAQLVAVAEAGGQRPSSSATPASRRSTSERSL